MNAATAGGAADVALVFVGTTAKEGEDRDNLRLSQRQVKGLGDEKINLISLSLLLYITTRSSSSSIHFFPFFWGLCVFDGIRMTLSEQ